MRRRSIVRRLNRRLLRRTEPQSLAAVNLRLPERQPGWRENVQARLFEQIRGTVGTKGKAGSDRRHDPPQGVASVITGRSRARSEEPHGWAPARRTRYQPFSGGVFGFAGRRGARVAGLRDGALCAGRPDFLRAGFAASPSAATLSSAGAAAGSAAATGSCAASSGGAAVSAAGACLRAAGLRGVRAARRRSLAGAGASSAAAGASASTASGAAATGSGASARSGVGARQLAQAVSSADGVTNAAWPSPP